MRQNLGMLVDGGQPTAASASPGNWGGSVAGVATARSAVGVDANGGLVWAGGRVSPNDLARALVAGGAVRGMQLDINPDWVNFNLYAPGPDNVVHGQPVYGATSADRYLTPELTRLHRHRDPRHHRARRHRQARPGHPRHRSHRQVARVPRWRRSGTLGPERRQEIQVTEVMATLPSTSRTTTST